MPRYKFAPAPEEAMQTEHVEDKVEQLSAYEDTKPRSGTLPETYNEYHGIPSFNYVWEEIEERETLDGVIDVPNYEEYPVVFLCDRYVAYKVCNQKIEGELLGTISSNFVPGYSLKPVEFEEETLRSVLKDADSVLRLDVAPKRREKPDKVSAQDTKLEETDFPEEHDVDPFEKVKVELPDEGVDVSVGFDKSGIVILYGRDMEMRDQVQILQVIAETVVDEYLDHDSFQASLFRGDQP